MSTAETCPLCLTASATLLCEASSPVGLRHYWHCPVCDLVYLDPRQRLDENSEKAEYALHDNRIDDEGYCRFLERLIHPLKNKLTTRPKGQPQGLDFGCGPGPVLAELMGRQGFIMDTYDPFFAPNQACLDRRYDFITCSEVVEHLYHPLDVFQQLDQLLAPDGWLGVMTHMRTSWEGFADWHYRREPTHVCFYSPTTMAWIQRTFGWEMEIMDERVVLFHKSNL